MTNTLIVMGVTGSGKTTLGQALAQALGWPFIEGDSLHPPANIAKMAAGIALDDADRVPFLESIANTIINSPPRLVISCSALKRAYRDRLRGADPQLRFVLPLLCEHQLQVRLQQRRGHFMPPTLLKSQLAAFERPACDERCIELDGAAPIERQVAQTLAQI